MLYQQKTIDILLKKFKEKDFGHASLLNDLIYGKDMQYFDIMRPYETHVTLYLHENYPEILIALSSSGQSLPFDIRRIKTERQSYRLGEILPFDDKLSLVLMEDHAQVILRFDSSEQRQQFKKGIKQIAKLFLNYESELDSSIIKNFIEADKNNNEVLSQHELNSLFRQIKLGDQTQIKDLWEFIAPEFQMTNNIGFMQFEKIARILTCRMQIRQIFEKYTRIKIPEYRAMFEKLMTQSKFKQFLVHEQEESPQNAQIIAKSLFPPNQADNPDVIRNNKISFYDFSLFLMSSANCAIKSTYFQAQTPLDDPLYLYYCHSSHNTYLTGNQLTSDSRSERYYQDLKDGIRCVQIDVHDGDYGPTVKHGYTMTSSLRFADVISTIQKFQRQNPNHTPIILSIENHCSALNQSHMAKILVEYFKDNLVTIPEYEKQGLTLRNSFGKIIVKCSGNMKIFKEMLGNKIEVEEISIEKQREEEVMEQAYSSQKFMENSSIFDPNKKSKVGKDKNFIKEEKMFGEQLLRMQGNKQKFLQAQPALIDFIKENGPNIYESKQIIEISFLKITSMLGNGILGQPSPWESCSVSQSAVLSYFSNKTCDKILHHTKGGWLRAYPRGARFDSSNYNPMPSLQLGIQLVALNTQACDYPTYIMQRFFDYGTSLTRGYRLKPDLEKIAESNKDIDDIKVAITPISASKIYFNDPKKRNQVPNCQLRMKFYGLSRDLQKNLQQIVWKNYTQTVKLNAYNPIYQSPKTMIVRYSHPDLCFVVLEVPQCGISVIPLGYIQKGIRVITLFDDQLLPKESKILLRIE